MTSLYTKYFCIRITFNNPIKICFYNKKYPVTIQIHIYVYRYQRLQILTHTHKFLTLNIRLLIKNEPKLIRK